MNRIEKVREYVDTVLLNISDATERRCSYLHLYGVSQVCTLISLKRRENIELSTIAGMLNDIYTYSTMDTKDPAHKGAAMAKEILSSLQIFIDDEIVTIFNAIYNHSSKGSKHSPFDEVLIDADVSDYNKNGPYISVGDKIMINCKYIFNKVLYTFGYEISIRN